MKKKKNIPEDSFTPQRSAQDRPKQNRSKKENDNAEVYGENDNLKKEKAPPKKNSNREDIQEG